MLTIVTPQDEVDLTTGRMWIHWPAIDGRRVDTVTDWVKCEMARSFIAGYRVANPQADDAAVSAAVLKWATR
jgi:hypothetical protein